MKFSTERPLVCVQGLGFVGAAMAVAVANAVNKQGEPLYNVMGIELPTANGYEKVEKINHGVFPCETVDRELQSAQKKAKTQGNLVATTDESWFGKADIVLSDINLDVCYDDKKKPYLDLSGYNEALHTIGSLIQPGTLLIVETTVPPGTCEKVVMPILKEEFVKRGIDPEEVQVAHSYERVMPGADYYNSIVNYWRVFSGINEQSADACEKFLSHVINVKTYPLTRLSCTTASETSKVLENSYRAATIAFMEEWGRFAEAAGFDLYEVVDAIRKRPTHSNMRQPGFGVGGYCLTKDPYFAMLGAEDILGLKELEFPFSMQAVQINNKMPLVSLDKMEQLLGGISGKKILVLGVSYRQDVGDTRYSPSEIFVKEAIKRGAILDFHDPLVSFWKEMERAVLEEIPSPDHYDAIIFTVQHKEYMELDMKKWLGTSKVLVFDSNKVLSEIQLKQLKETDCIFSSIGRGGKQ